MKQDELKNGQAFLCIKDVFYKSGPPEKMGQQSFTKGKLYYITMNCYLLDDRKITKNYAWFKDNFERSPENDVVPVKSKKGRKKSDA